MGSAPVNSGDSQQLVEVTAGLECCYPQLYRFLLRRLSNRAAAQDLAQEAYLRLLRIEKKHFIQQPAAYLFRVAANLVYEFQLQERRNSNHISLEKLIEEQQPMVDGSAADADSDPERLLGQREVLQRIEAALADMPPLYVTILVLCKRDGLSHLQIAEKLQISIHTVRKYLTRAVTRCRVIEHDAKRKD
jgi:RNA polymerase sigma-19 factor, ECF subfamily